MILDCDHPGPSAPPERLLRSTHAPSSGTPISSSRHPRSRIEYGSLWLLSFSGAIALIEPSPYDAVFPLAALVFLWRGLVLHRSILVLAALLAALNIGGLFSLMPFFDEARSVTFVVISTYLALSSIVFAIIMMENSVERLEAVKRGYTWAGVVASLAGLLGYFDVAGLGSVFSLYDRASGTFKDPNVLGVFVILPLVFVAQDLVLRRGSFLRNVGLFGIILFGGVFLSFSRGAWGHAAASILLMLALMFVSTSRAPVRRRIVVIGVVGAVALAGALAAALTVEAVRSMVETRASLQQSYDLGETGRFGNQLRSIEKLLDHPNGFGPLRFRFHFPEDPHNVYVNAFASYGWLGGISYAMLALVTIVVGWKTVVRPGPVQPYAIAIWSVLFIQILQGFQIDTDHWRHWYLMLGLTWGLFAVTQPGRRPIAETARIA